MPRKKNPNNNYFNPEVEQAVCDYLASEDDRERNKLFKIIYPAFSKIAEVMYHKVKFSYSDDDIEDVMAGCVAHMIEKMHMFQCGRGTKAFSYFTVMAKYYYILLSNKNYKHFKRYIPMSNFDDKFDRPNSDERDAKALEAASLLEAFTDYLELNVNQIIPNKNHRMVGITLVDILKNFENLEHINRRKIVNQMGDIQGMPARPTITKVMNDITAQYNLFKERWDSGDTSMEFIEKTKLTKEEMDYIKTEYQAYSKSVGAAKLAKKFGVQEKVVRTYLNPI